MKKLGIVGLAAALLFASAAFEQSSSAKAAGGPAENASGTYRVLAPIESGNLLLYPVVREDGTSGADTPFVTLDEGLKSGEVEVTEAGKARGLVRPRGGNPQPGEDSYRGDEVNTLVLVNRSKRPLLLLAGEIVTGGKQDRIIAKDRIVPADADPIDLSVFCIEPGRWTESSANFHASAKSSMGSFMVQPEVREKAMVEQDQQQVWNSVNGAISQMQMATALTASRSESRGYEPGAPAPGPLGTTSYAKAMEDDAVSKKVDEAAAPVMQAREQVLAKLREDHAIGVVVAVRGEIIWADLFANTDLLSRYWTKLVRSYAAESLTEGENHPAPGVAEAQLFLNAPSVGRESSAGDVGVYRYSEMKNGDTETFVLDSLLPGTDYSVHVSKMRIRDEESRTQKPRSHPIIRPDFIH